MREWRIDGRVYIGRYASVDAAVFGALRKDGFSTWNPGEDSILIGVEYIGRAMGSTSSCKRVI